MSTAAPEVPASASAPPADRTTPRLYRRQRPRVFGGVAGGIADHLGVRVAPIRAVFILLAMAGGFGVVLYGAFWIVLPDQPGVEGRKRRLPNWVEYTAAAVVAGFALWGVQWSLPAGRLVIPIALACLGGALIWRQASDTQRERWWKIGRSSLTGDRGDTGVRVRLAIGAAAVIGGAGLVVSQATGARIWSAAIAVLVTIIGVALITGPWWLRLATELGRERAERIRTQERADIAAHLHDSVLQTLALIQRNADSPREVARLARGQERELRTLLYGERAATGRLATALKSAAAEVEDRYAVAVDVVVVGDVGLDDHLAALVAACREALVNAAKHAGVTSMSLYGEVEPDEVVVYVKDRGTGFDIEQVPGDRQGIRGSIIGRVERHGGTVKVRSSAGEGTEVEIRMGR